MYHRLAWLIPALVLTAPARADELPGKLVQETWNAAYLGTHKAGYVYTAVREIVRDGATYYSAATELNLTLKRFQDTIQLRMETGTVETAAGRVTGVMTRQYLGKNQTMVLTGTVLEGNQLHIQVDGGKRDDKKIRWNDQVIGLYSQERMFQKRPAQAGDEFSYQSYEPTLTAVVTVRVAVKDLEEVELFGVKKKLLRVETRMEKFMGVQLPALILWLDEKGVAQRQELEIPELGKMTLYRTTKAKANVPNTASLSASNAPTLNSLIRMPRRILGAYDHPALVYRLRVKGDDEPATTFAKDDRQEVKNVLGEVFEVHVQAAREPAARAKSPDVGKEFKESCRFLKSDDARVVAHARDAVGDATDPWEKAKRIERWVHRKVENKNFTEAFTTADEVARTLEGDCTEHAMLAAAMCRAAGVPSKIAVGLIYIEEGPQRSPALGFHMWFEVWVRGQWVPLDATLGRGFVGASHLKISDHSWHNMQALTPLLPVVRVLGKLSVEEVRVKGAE